MQKHLLHRYAIFVFLTIFVGVFALINTVDADHSLSTTTQNAFTKYLDKDAALSGAVSYLSQLIALRNSLAVQHNTSSGAIKAASIGSTKDAKHDNYKAGVASVILKAIELIPGISTDISLTQLVSRADEAEMKGIHPEWCLILRTALHNMITLYRVECQSIFIKESIFLRIRRILNGP